MFTRLLSVSFLSLSASLFGVSCARAGSGDSQPVASCEPPSGNASTMVQCDRLISGNPNFPVPIAEALRRGAQEEASAMNPCIAIREQRLPTVSQAEHYGEAVRQYQKALSLLDTCTDACGDRVALRRSLN